MRDATFIPPPWPGYSAMHNNVGYVGAGGNWRCTKCHLVTMFGAHGLCPGRHPHPARSNGGDA